MAALRQEMQAGFEAANRRIAANGARIDRLVEQVSLLMERMAKVEVRPAPLN